MEEQHIPQQIRTSGEFLNSRLFSPSKFYSCYGILDENELDFISVGSFIITKTTPCYLTSPTIFILTRRLPMSSGFEVSSPSSNPVMVKHRLADREGSLVSAFPSSTIAIFSIQHYQHRILLFSPNLTCSLVKISTLSSSGGGVRECT